VAKWRAFAWVAFLLAAQARAEPYMAVREGLKCSGCHVNVTGGGKRTEIIAAHGRDILHYPDFFKEISAPAEAFTGEIHRFVGIGANLRASNTAIFQEKGADGTVDNNTAFRGRLDENELEVNEAVGFLEVRLIPDYLTFYVDQRFAPQTDTREVWGMLRGVFPWSGFIKAGEMFLPYGLQLQDDDAFIRGGRNGSVNTGFSFDQQQAAVEIGVEPGPFSVIAAVSEGAPRDRDVQVTATAYTLLSDLEIPIVRNFLLGASFSRVGPPDVQTLLFGFFTGVSMGPFTYLGEVDFRSDKDDTTGGKSRGRFIHYSEGNYLLFDWLNLKVAFDYADDDGDLSRRTDDSENRFSIGFEPFWNRFLQTRVFYRVSNGIESNPTHNQDLWIAELHAFF
jgi:hypothetical protein